MKHIAMVLETNYSKKGLPDGHITINSYTLN